MYYILFLLGTILALINDKKGISFKLFVGALALFAFFRYGIGADYFAYEYLYNKLSYSLLEIFEGDSETKELGFRLFGWLFKSTGFTYQQYLILIAILNLYYVAKICREYSKNPTMSLLVYFAFHYLTWTFSSLRQGLALAVGIYYLLKCTEQEKVLKFVVIVLLLSQIHMSAIILIPLFFISRIEIKKSMLIYLLLTSLVISLIPFGKMLSDLTWLPFVDRLLPYLSTSFSWSNLLDFKSLGRIVFLVIAFSYYDSFTKQGEISKKILNIYIFSFILYFIFQFSELTAARLSIYGRMLDILILPNLYYLHKEAVHRALVVFALVGLCFVYLSKNLIDLQRHFEGVKTNPIKTPYSNVFSKDDYTFSSKYYHLTK